MESANMQKKHCPFFSRSIIFQFTFLCWIRPIVSQVRWATSFFAFSCWYSILSIYGAQCVNRIQFGELPNCSISFLFLGTDFRIRMYVCRKNHVFFVYFTVAHHNRKHSRNTLHILHKETPHLVHIVKGAKTIYLWRTNKFTEWIQSTRFTYNETFENHPTCFTASWPLKNRQTMSCLLANGIQNFYMEYSRANYG